MDLGGEGQGLEPSFRAGLAGSLQPPFQICYDACSSCLSSCRPLSRTPGCCTYTTALT